MTRLECLYRAGSIGPAAYQAGEGFRADWLTACQAIGPANPIRETVARLGELPCWMLAQIAVYDRSWGETGKPLGIAHGEVKRRVVRALTALAAP